MDIFCGGSMNYGEMGRVNTSPEIMLKEAGFAVSEKCCARPSCFDFAARKNGNLILVKIQPDIDGFSSNDYLELKSIADFVSAASVLIGENSREKPLEDDTVYSRYNVSVITSKTFENMIHKAYPLIHAGPGGYYVEIYGETIKKRRQDLGLSVGEIAEMVGLSRRTLYGYERGMAKASVATAYNLIYILGVPVAKPINLFEKQTSQRRCLLDTAKSAIAKNKFLQKICSKFSRYRITAVKKAPFDFIISVPEEKTKIIGGVADRKERKLDERVDEMLSFSKIVKGYAILIADERNLTDNDIVCIPKEELSKIKNPEDLIARI